MDHALHERDIGIGISVVSNARRLLPLERAARLAGRSRLNQRGLLRTGRRGKNGCNGNRIDKDCRQRRAKTGQSDLRNSNAVSIASLSRVAQAFSSKPTATGLPHTNWTGFTRAPLLEARGRADGLLRVLQSSRSFGVASASHRRHQQAGKGGCGEERCDFEGFERRVV